MSDYGPERLMASPWTISVTDATSNFEDTPSGLIDYLIRVTKGQDSVGADGVGHSEEVWESVPDFEQRLWGLAEGFGGSSRSYDAHSGILPERISS